MKRSDALAPLSRDHHHALEAALRLRRASEETVDAAVERFTAFWQSAGARHFDIEESLLLPALPADDAEWAEAAERVRREHDDVRTRTRALTDARPTVESARELGELLNAHVRFEERHLFPLLEERLPSAELAALGRAVEAAENA